MIRLDDIPARGPQPALKRQRRMHTIRGTLKGVHHRDELTLRTVWLEVITATSPAEAPMQCHRGFAHGCEEQAAAFAARMSACIGQLVEVEGENWWHGGSGTFLLGVTRAELVAHIDRQGGAR